jgi:hypothetical protein
MEFFQAANGRRSSLTSEWNGEAELAPLDSMMSDGLKTDARVLG